MNNVRKGVALESADVRLETCPRLRGAAGRHFELYLELFGSDPDRDTESIPPFRVCGSLWEALADEVAPNPILDGDNGAARFRGAAASSGGEATAGIEAPPEVFLSRARRGQAQKVRLEKTVNLVRRLFPRFA